MTLRSGGTDKCVRLDTTSRDVSLTLLVGGERLVGVVSRELRLGQAVDSVPKVRRIELPSHIGEPITGVVLDVGPRKPTMIVDLALAAGFERDPSAFLLESARVARGFEVSRYSKPESGWLVD